MISLLVLFLDFFFAGLSGKGFIADRAIFSFAVMLEIPLDFALGLSFAYFVEWLKCRH